MKHLKRLQRYAIGAQKRKLDGQANIQILMLQNKSNRYIAGVECKAALRNGHLELKYGRILELNRHDVEPRIIFGFVRW